jgi:hypothetical protein
MSEIVGASLRADKQAEEAMSASLMGTILAMVLAGQDQPTPLGAEDRKEQLRFFKEKAAELALYRGTDAKEPQPLTPEPILRYSNPEREIGSLDGATFLWLEGTRPVAAVSFSVRKLNNTAYRECTSFIGTPLVCRAGELPIWSPKTGGLLAQPLSDAPAPADSKVRRLTQMRTLARRFAADCHHSKTDKATELRLLPQPLYRFAEEKEGLVDGALFGFVVSNDPELFLLLEAVRDADRDEAKWRFSLARMSSLKQTIRLDGKEVWSVPNFYQDKSEDRKTGPYVERAIGPFIPSAAPQDK